MRRYTISVEGLGSVEQIAPTAGKARYQCWLHGASDCGEFKSFGDFVRRASTLHHGPVS
jgi:hypothetical protein